MPALRLARDDIARGELVGEAMPLASSRSAPAPRRASLRRKPEPAQRRWVELDELEVRDPRSCPVGHGDPSPTAPAGLVVRSQSAAAPPVANSVARAVIGPPSVDDADTAMRRARPTPRARLPDRDPWMAEDPVARIGRSAVRRRAAGVDDAGAQVSTLEPQAPSRTRRPGRRGRRPAPGLRSSRPRRRSDG